MTPELENKLRRKYAKLFRQYLRGRMIDCNDGWLPIITDCLKALEYFAQKSNCRPRIIQIKEKFGGLRIYMYAKHATQIQRQIIDAICNDAAHKAAMTCEKCGEYGELRKGSWLQTLCDSCESERQ